MVVLEGTEVLVRTTKYRSVRVSEELIRASVHGHAFGTLHICQDNRVVCVSGVQHKGFDCTIEGLRSIKTLKHFEVKNKTFA